MDIPHDAEMRSLLCWEEEVAWLRHGVPFAEALCLLCWEDLDKRSQAVCRGTFRMGSGGS